MSDETPQNPFDAPENEIPPVIEAEDEALSQGAPGVASRPGKTYIMLGVVGVVVLFLVYSMFSGKSSDDVVDEQPTERKVPVDSNPIKLPDQPVQPVFPVPPPPNPTPDPEPTPEVDNPVLPTPPPIDALPVPPQPPDIINTPIDPKEDAAAQQQALARLGSGLFLINGGAENTGTPAGPATGNQPSTGDPNGQFAQNAQNSTAERVTATKIPNLSRTIAQGRIIQATLETAINTDLAAPIRAIVSVDTYGEAGMMPLIPKGSRLIGTYNTTLTSGQTRVFVIWSRVIRPDGVDVPLGSPLIDAIGQAGVAGQLDTRFQEIFARSLVSSAMNIAMAIGSDKLSGGSGQNSTTSSANGTQTSGDTISTATVNALDKLGGLSDNFIQRFINVPPTILVDQGTKVNVIVNKDIFFPDDTSGVRLINQ